jgi:peptidoglycan hydrolase FlgJ
MQIEGFDSQPLRHSSENTPGRAKEEAKLNQACQQFEEMYLTQMFAQMRKSCKSKDGLGGGQQEEMFQGMLDGERAKSWSKEGGVGLANLLYQQMKQSL